MKKIVTLFLLYLFVSCSSDDPSETYLEKVQLVLNQDPTSNPRMWFDPNMETYSKCMRKS